MAQTWVAAVHPFTAPTQDLPQPPRQCRQAPIPSPCGNISSLDVHQSLSGMACGCTVSEAGAAAACLEAPDALPSLPVGGPAGAALAAAAAASLAACITAPERFPSAPMPCPLRAAAELPPTITRSPQSGLHAYSSLSTLPSVLRDR